MIIQQIYNNNVVLVLDENQKKELILTGCGIGFQKKKGQEVDKSKIERTFVTQDESFIDKIGKLASQVDEKFFEVSTEVIAHAEGILNTELYEYIYVALTDHIAFAIKRYHENITIKNDLLHEIKRIHKKEYEIGKWAVDYINKEFNVEFPLDEAGFIAMHIVNSNYKGSSKESLLITKIVKDILNIIRYYYRVEFKEDDINYDRLLTHLKFFANRLVKREELNDTNSDIVDIIKIKYEKDYNCAYKIKTHVEKNYDYYVSQDELLYLTLHIKRVISVLNS
ncbi:MULTISPECIES: BglG family transcription antiterminator LicT [unclassified Clostridioides]|uniref:BglG family transcription antiterminator LicT n=1 Tax=unclassified Clostridioides TaxID=2635829 RepID=UPI001D110A22|nr:PRD domain-containing protein [Clostridioides sp. ZZV14-6045]MCC0731512.1 PRD domain-containing protein [Clostridioides sp. ZZV14-6048]MCC0733055.1 PRD domain-containing protein [Clostridioides sp. ZZV14-6009]MCC0737411.1 PRD domain-containing protein [Clostridioides sp. ZZV14-5902]